MNDTLHFQASFVGDQTESIERFTKEVNEHMKESTGSSKAQREAIEATNERVTQRRCHEIRFLGLISCSHFLISPFRTYYSNLFLMDYLSYFHFAH